jgi:hypothetical protein
MNEEIEKYVAKYGEQYRGTIERAFAFIEERKEIWGPEHALKDMNMDIYIEEGMKKVCYPTSAGRK